MIGIVHIIHVDVVVHVDIVYAVHIAHVEIDVLVVQPFPPSPQTPGNTSTLGAMFSLSSCLDALQFLALHPLSQSSRVLIDKKGTRDSKTS